MDESYIQDSSTDKDKTMEEVAPEKQPSPTKSNMEIDQEDSDNVTQRISNLSCLNSTEKEQNLKPMNLNFDQDLVTPNGKPKTTKPGKKSLCRHCNEPISAASRKSHEHKCALYLKLVEKTSHGSKPYKCLGLNCTMKYATRAIAYGHVSNKHLQELNQKDTAEEAKVSNIANCTNFFLTNFTKFLLFRKIRLSKAKPFKILNQLMTMLLKLVRTMSLIKMNSKIVLTKWEPLAQVKNNCKNFAHANIVQRKLIFMEFTCMKKLAKRSLW